jgi:hypothetical protein
MNMGFDYFHEVFPKNLFQNKVYSFFCPPKKTNQKKGARDFSLRLPFGTANVRGPAKLALGAQTLRGPFPCPELFLR